MHQGPSPQEKPESLARRVLLWAALVGVFGAGVVIVYIASTPVVDLVGEDTLEGTASIGTSFVPLTLPSAAAVEVTLSASPCGMDYHFLQERQWVDFNQSGVLPFNPIGCEQRNASLLPGVVALAIENRRGEPTDYRFDLSFFVLRSPLGFYTFPGLLLVLVGSIGIIILIMRGGLRRTVDQIIAKKR